MMMLFRKPGFLLPVAVALLCCAGRSDAQPATPSLAELRAGFLDPPAAARLRCYWWWLNGNTDKATITHDLEEMKAKGFGGALLVDANGAEQNGNHSVPAGPRFGSPAWTELFTHAVKEADRLGLEITLNITSGWNLGGPNVKPEQASKILTYSRMQVTGGAPAHVLPAAPAALNGFYRQIALLAYPLANGAALAPQPGNGSAAMILRGRSAAVEAGPFSMPDTSGMLNDGVPGDGATFAPGYADTALAQVKDISASVAADGTLNWTPPPGDWEILRIGYTDSGAKVSTSSETWQGLAIDYLSRNAFMQYWNENVEPLLTAATALQESEVSCDRLMGAGRHQLDRRFSPAVSEAARLRSGAVAACGRRAHRRRSRPEHEIPDRPAAHRC